MIFDPSKPPLTDSAGLLKSIPVEAEPEIWKRATKVISSGLVGKPPAQENASWTFGGSEVSFLLI